MKCLKILFFLQGISYLLFFYYSDGLNFTSKDGSLSSTDFLYSSGNNDDISVFMAGVVCLFSSLVLLIKKNASTNMFVTVVVISIIFQLFAMTLIQVGSVALSIFEGHNPYLIFGLACQLAIVIITIRGFYKQ
jgi:hypothetical protein